MRPDCKGAERVAVVGELVEPPAMEPKGGTLESNRKSDLGVTGSKIWLKIHLRGATEGSESPITAHVVVANNPLDSSDRFCW
ncbi:MAG TPA: hypothetical protein DCZ76_04230 [Treponema sp.]|nr:hypothetical protein [Treponema sp.]